MAFDISRFSSEALGYGLIRPSHFLAAIPVAPAWYGGSTRFLSYLCSAASLPGTQILTSEERIRGYGPAHKIPYDVASSDLTLTFYSDGNGEVLAFFDNWLRNVVAFGNTSKSDPINGASFGEVQYPDHYETGINLYVYNENPGNRGDPDNAVEIIKYTMDHAYPVSVSDITMDWSDGEQVQMITVTFAFKTFWIEKNIAAKYGQGSGVVRDGGYLDRARGSGSFDGENEYAKYAADYAESTTPGLIGLPFVDQLVGIASSIYSSVTSKVTAINGFASRINSQLGSIGALASIGRSKSKPLKVPQVPTIRFP